MSFSKSSITPSNLTRIHRLESKILQRTNDTSVELTIHNLAANEDIVGQNLSHLGVSMSNTPRNGSHFPLPKPQRSSTTSLPALHSIILDDADDTGMLPISGPQRRPSTLSAQLPFPNDTSQAGSSRRGDGRRTSSESAASTVPLAAGGVPPIQPIHTGRREMVTPPRLDCTEMQRNPTEHETPASHRDTEESSTEDIYVTAVSSGPKSLLQRRRTSKSHGSTTLSSTDDKRSGLGQPSPRVNSTNTGHHDTPAFTPISTRPQHQPLALDQRQDFASTQPPSPATSEATALKTASTILLPHHSSRTKPGQDDIHPSHPHQHTVRENIAQYDDVTVFSLYNESLFYDDGNNLSLDPSQGTEDKALWQSHPRLQQLDLSDDQQIAKTRILEPYMGANHSSQPSSRILHDQPTSSSLAMAGPPNNPTNDLTANSSSPTWSVADKTKPPTGLTNRAKPRRGKQTAAHHQPITDLLGTPSEGNSNALRASSASMTTLAKDGSVHTNDSGSHLVQLLETYRTSLESQQYVATELRAKVQYLEQTVQRLESSKAKLKQKYTRYKAKMQKSVEGSMETQLKYKSLVRVHQHSRGLQTARIQDLTSHNAFLQSQLTELRHQVDKQWNVITALGGAVKGDEPNHTVPLTHPHQCPYHSALGYQDSWWDVTSTWLMKNTTIDNRLGLMREASKSSEMVNTTWYDLIPTYVSNIPSTNIKSERPPEQPSSPPHSPVVINGVEIDVQIPFLDQSLAIQKLIATSIPTVTLNTPQFKSILYQSLSRDVSHKVAAQLPPCSCIAGSSQPDCRSSSMPVHNGRASAASIDNDMAHKRKSPLPFTNAVHPSSPNPTNPLKTPVKKKQKRVCHSPLLQTSPSICTPHRKSGAPSHLSTPSGYNNAQQKGNSLPHDGSFPLTPSTDSAATQHAYLLATPHKTPHRDQKTPIEQIMPLQYNIIGSDIETCSPSRLIQPGEGSSPSLEAVCLGHDEPLQDLSLFPDLPDYSVEDEISSASSYQPCRVPSQLQSDDDSCFESDCDQAKSGPTGTDDSDDLDLHPMVSTPRNYWKCRPSYDNDHDLSLVFESTPTRSNHDE